MKLARAQAIVAEVVAIFADDMRRAGCRVDPARARLIDYVESRTEKEQATLASGGDPFLAEAKRLWRSSGAAYVEIPFGAELDPRVVPVAAFPAGAALAVALAGQAGLDANHPWWVDAYLSTARRHAR